MRALKIAMIAAAGLALTGCDYRRPTVESPGHSTTESKSFSGNISATGIFGGANVTALSLQCVGRIALTQGQAIVRDGCFSGDTNVVICTDASAPNPIKCAPAAGKLEISGSGSDVISYARLH
jgi:hypothetical protein